MSLENKGEVGLCETPTCVKPKEARYREAANKCPIRSIDKCRISVRKVYGRGERDIISREGEGTYLDEECALGEDIKVRINRRGIDSDKLIDEVLLA